MSTAWIIGGIIVAAILSFIAWCCLVVASWSDDQADLW